MALFRARDLGGAQRHADVRNPLAGKPDRQPLGSGQHGFGRRQAAGLRKAQDQVAMDRIRSGRIEHHRGRCAGHRIAR